MEETRGQKIAGTIFAVAIVVCSMEMVPGWGMFHLGWPPDVFYVIMAVAGVASAFCAGGRHVVPALAGFPLGGVGALFAIAWMLERVNVVYSVMLIIVGLIGAIPGAAIYFALRFLQDTLFPPQESPRGVEARRENDGPGPR